MNEISIRQFTQDEWQLWKTIRLEMLKNSPEAFGSSYDVEAGKPDEDFKSSLSKGTIFGAFINSELVGCAGFFILEQIKMRHRGVLFSMYVRPENRGLGIANRLVETVIDHAKPRVMQLHITCVTTNSTALQLYEKYGFRIYGTEPRSLKIGYEYYDEHMMVLRFA
jgi:ribosomal protein S18 acetylase RimI-like enzyme